MRKKEFDLREISLSRAHLMGLATLWIVLFHSIHLDFYQPWLLARPHLLDILNRLREAGNCGVDIFLFLSGLGLVFSWIRLRETSDYPLRTFYARRLERVLPPALIVSVLFYGLTGTESLTDWLGRVFFYGSFSYRQASGQYWFFSLLLALYLLFPLIWKAIDRWGGWGALGWILASILWALALKFWIHEDYFEDTEILWTRIPIFVVGVFFGKLIQGEVKIPRWVAALSIPLAIAVWYEIRRIPGNVYFLRRYAYGVLTLLIALGHGWLCSLRKQHGWCYRAVACVGSYSLEIYLLYEVLYLYNPLGMQDVDAVGIVYAVTVFVLSLVLSVLLRMIVDQLRKKMGQLDVKTD